MAKSTVSRPCRFQLEDISLDALRWGEGNPIRVIALHGWLDNAASFSLLAPHLHDLDLVVLDLAGHGRSDFRSGATAYNIWQDLIEIAQVADELGWARFSLLGHSRGAMIASLYAGTFPAQIDKLCCIDAITPVTVDESQLPQQLARSINGLRKINDKRSTYFDSYEQAAIARMRGAYPLSEAASRLLAERSVIKANKGYVWRYDKRLLLASEIRLSDAQAKAFVDAFECDAKVILAEGGFMDENSTRWHAEHPHLDIVEIPGEHHLQLSDNPKTITLLAQIINEYFS